MAGNTILGEASNNATDISNYTLAASLAGTVVVNNPSIVTSLFSYVVGGIFASFGARIQDLVWVSSSPVKRKAKSKTWHNAISPEGHRHPEFRQMSLKSNWEARKEAILMAGPGMVHQNGNYGLDDGRIEPGLEGKDEEWGNWGDYKEEKRKMDERTKLRKEAGGHHGDVPPYILEYAPLIHLYSKEEWWPGDIDLQ